MICPQCDSSNVIKNGKTSGKQRYICNNCLGRFREPVPATPVFKPVSNDKTWVITTAINNSPTNIPFFESLLGYCRYRNAELLIIPMTCNKTTDDDVEWDHRLSDYLIEADKFQLIDKLKVLRPRKAANPLTGLEQLGNGDSLIIPSPITMMRTAAVDHISLAAEFHTTGTISYPNYSNTMTGDKDERAHSFAALVIEEDRSIESFHIRVLKAADDGTFIDVDREYHGNVSFEVNNIPGIVLGDEHAIFIDPLVKKATFTDTDSMCKTLNPQKLIRHDILDSFSITHHHNNRNFIKYHKYLTGLDSLKQELVQTLNYLAETTFPGTQSIIVASNHDEHVDRWLETTPSNQVDPINSEIYHHLHTLKRQAISRGEVKPAFELWCNNAFKTNQLVFLNTKSSYKICGIELALHGHNGTNGSRSSPAQFAKLGVKTTVGHSHSPSILHDAYCVGHSCIADLEYNKGASSWRQAHCLIHSNGHRQMIFIKHGKWRR